MARVRGQVGKMVSKISWPQGEWVVQRALKQASKADGQVDGRREGGGRERQSAGDDKCKSPE